LAYVTNFEKLLNISPLYLPRYSGVPVLIFIPPSSYPYIFLFYVINIKRKPSSSEGEPSNGGVVGGWRDINKDKKI